MANYEDVCNSEAGSSIGWSHPTDGSCVDDLCGCALLDAGVDFADKVHLERLFRKCESMEAQVDISEDMYTMICDCLVEGHCTYRLRTSTLFLSVSLLRQYLSRKRVDASMLQLASLVALLIAAKFEEVDFSSFSGSRACSLLDLYSFNSTDDILVMECEMLNTLDFQVTIPTAAHFFELLQNVNGCDDLHREVAEYLLELVALDVHMLNSYSPSHIASAVLLLSNEMVGKLPVWPPHMVEYSRHAEQVLRGSTEELQKLVDAASKSGCRAPCREARQRLTKTARRITKTLPRRAMLQSSQAYHQGNLRRPWQRLCLFPWHEPRTPVRSGQRPICI